MRIEEIEDPLMREIRYLDKLIDELARGKPMVKSSEKSKIIIPGGTMNPVDEYINNQPRDIRPILNQVRELILRMAPEAQETISYAMPAYKLKGLGPVFLQ